MTNPLTDKPSIPHSYNPDTGAHVEPLPEQTLIQKADEFLMGDCETCRYFRMGVIVGVGIMAVIAIIT